MVTRHCATVLGGVATAVDMLRATVLRVSYLAGTSARHRSHPFLPRSARLCRPLRPRLLGCGWRRRRPGVQRRRAAAAAAAGRRRWPGLLTWRHRLRRRRLGCLGRPRSLGRPGRVGGSRPGSRWRWARRAGLPECEAWEGGGRGGRGGGGGVPSHGFRQAVRLLHYVLSFFYESIT